MLAVLYEVFIYVPSAALTRSPRSQSYRTVEDLRRATLCTSTLCHILFVAWLLRRLQCNDVGHVAGKEVIYALFALI